MTTGSPPGSGPGPVLKWTGNGVNLAELAYWLWLTGQLNYGNVSISEIVVWLERHLQVRIGDVHEGRRVLPHEKG